VTGLIARGAGLVQWLWHTNSYMTSDNENFIGLVRVDGSIKPEMEIMQEFGRLIRLLREQLLEQPSVPDVWVVVPYTQWFAHPEQGRYAVQQAVHVLAYDCGIVPQVVGEEQLLMLLARRARPRAIIVPGLQRFNEQAWRALLSYVHGGGTALVSGVVGRDTHNIVFAAGVDGMDVRETRSVAHYEEFQDTLGEVQRLTFVQERVGLLRKAHNRASIYLYGEGILTWCGLPLELACEEAAISRVYRQALGMPVVGNEQRVKQIMLQSRQVLHEGTLVLLVSEMDSAQWVYLDNGEKTMIAPNRAGAVFIRQDGAVETFGGVTCER
jgi:hypothetical protein